MNMHCQNELKLTAKSLSFFKVFKHIFKNYMQMIKEAMFIVNKKCLSRGFHYN